MFVDTAIANFGAGDCSRGSWCKGLAAEVAVPFSPLVDVFDFHFVGLALIYFEVAVLSESLVVRGEVDAYVANWGLREYSIHDYHLTAEALFCVSSVYADLLIMLHGRKEQCRPAASNASARLQSVTFTLASHSPKGQQVVQPQ